MLYGKCKLLREFCFYGLLGQPLFEIFEVEALFAAIVPHLRASQGGEVCAALQRLPIRPGNVGQSGLPVASGERRISGQGFRRNIYLLSYGF